MDTTSAPHRGRTLLLVLLTAVVAAVIAALTTVAAVAGHDRFDDVGAEHPHEDGIGFVADAGVSIGCTEDGAEYCPDDEVTRAQMGTFLYRLSGNDPETPPSVTAAHALQADHATSADSADHATTADSATSADQATSADSADQLVAGDLEDVASQVAHDRYDPPSIDAHSCQTDTVAQTGVDVSDVPYVVPAPNARPLIVTPMQQTSSDEISFQLCNPTDAAVDRPEGGWWFIALRPD